MSKKPAEPPKLEDWLTKQQAAQLLAVAEKTIDRMADRKEIQKATRKRPGLPPQVVFHPGDLERVKTSREQPPGAFIMPRGTPDGQESDMSNLAESFLAAIQAATRPALPAGSDHAEKTVRKPAVAIESKLFLTLGEAVAYTGLPRKHLRALIDSGKLEEHVVGKPGKGEVRRIRRADLEKL